MYRKVIFCLVVIAIASVQIANSLKCFQCDNPANCVSPSSQECTQDLANQTRANLIPHYGTVTELNSTDFSCFISTYVQNKTVAIDVRGCIMKTAINCDAKPINSTVTRDTCKVCTSDNCNTRNSVGTYSSSLVAMISLLVLAKAFVV